MDGERSFPSSFPPSFPSHCPRHACSFPGSVACNAAECSLRGTSLIISGILPQWESHPWSVTEADKHGRVRVQPGHMRPFPLVHYPLLHACSALPGVHAAAARLLPSLTSSHQFNQWLEGKHYSQAALALFLLSLPSFGTPPSLSPSPAVNPIPLSLSLTCGESYPCLPLPHLR